MYNTIGIKIERNYNKGKQSFLYTISVDIRPVNLEIHIYSNQLNDTE